ncbi:rod shape-determining protein MreC [Streptomyces sp. NPDC049881]|uniref:rod shape-determining protein MreC n=1 Tax=Streptomyces sp. NPDC049881 TaxID=3155778 RepID=UPI00343CBBAB
MRDTRESRLLLVLLVSIAFALISVDIRGGDNSPLDGPRQAAASLFGPVEEGVAGAVDPVANAIAAVRESGDRHDRISELERENAELRQQLGSDAHRDSRIEQLDDMLQTAGAGQYGVVAAQVIAIGAAQGFSWTVTIDAGTEDGITRDMTVLNGDGLVGRVTTVGSGTATVLLANDPGFTVGTRLEDSEELGFATGRGDNELEVQLLNQQARVAEGDRMVTFGSDDNRPFVPGVPVGEVVSVDRTAGDLTRTVRVRPYVSFTQLDLVGVVVEPPRDNPRDSVLPPRPEDRDEGRDEDERADRGARERDGDTGNTGNEDGPGGVEDGTREPEAPGEGGQDGDVAAEGEQPGGPGAGPPADPADPAAPADPADVE